jgi:hypothetical protein
MDPTIATILGAILGALFTGPITYYFTKNLIQKQEFYKAAAEFRSSFTDELRKLKSISSESNHIHETWLSVLSNSIVKHENACITFKPYLKKTERINFDKAWQKYCYPRGSDSKQMHRAFVEYGVDMSNHEAAALAIENINKLLNFAEFR